MGLVPFDEARRARVLRVCDGLDALAARLRRLGIGLLNEHHEIRGFTEDLREIVGRPGVNGRG